MAYTNWEEALEAEIKRENPDIGNFPAYSEETVTMAQHKQLGYILELLAQNRQGNIDRLQQVLLKKGKKVFDKIRTDMEKLNRYSINANTEAVEKQQDFLKDNRTIAQLAGRHYQLEDSECRDILMQKPGKQKRQNFLKFENRVFSQGIAAYFEQLSTACEVLFAFIDEAVKAAHKKYAAEIPEKKKMAEMISDMANELVENYKASTHQMIETEKAKLQREAESGKYTKSIPKTKTNTESERKENLIREIREVEELQGLEREEKEALIRDLRLGFPSRLYLDEKKALTRAAARRKRRRP